MHVEKQTPWEGEKKEESSRKRDWELQGSWDNWTEGLLQKLEKETREPDREVSTVTKSAELIVFLSTGGKNR